MKISINNKFTASLILLLSLGTMMSSNSYAQDQTDPAWTATQILTHYKSKNWKALVEYTTGNNKKFFNDIAGGGNSSRVTSGWRWDKVSAWDGKISEVRVGPRGAMFAKFAQQGKECFVVRMSKLEKKWYFDDVKSPNCETFNKYKVQ